MFFPYALGIVLYISYMLFKEVVMKRLNNGRFFRRMLAEKC